MTLCLAFPLASLGAEDWFDKGNAHFDAKQYKDAIDAYTKALKQTTDFADAHLNRGLAYTNQDDPHKAIAIALQVIEDVLVLAEPGFAVSTQLDNIRRARSHSSAPNTPAQEPQ